MGFLNFFARLIKPLVILILLTGGLIGMVYLLRFLFKETWEAFEENFTLQTKWMLERMSIFKPWKFWIMFLSGILMLICMGIFFGFALFSGQGAEGNLLP